MARVSRAERTKNIREFLRETPNMPHDSRSIKSATGVPKQLIDYKRSLSHDPSIRREMFVDPRTRTRRVYWTYVDAGRQSSDITEPEKLVFSSWCSWAERHKLNCPEYDLTCGRLPTFAVREPDEWRNRSLGAAVLPPEVFYIGMSKNLNKRPLGDHVGGKRRYRDNRQRHPGSENLYVSVCPVFAVGCEDASLWYALIQYLEMKLAWQYTSRHRLPLHYKKRRTASK